MNIVRWMIGLSMLMTSLTQAQMTQPYVWNHSLNDDCLIVDVFIPSGAYLYADRTSIEIYPATPLQIGPVSQAHTDDFGVVEIYDGGQTHRWIYSIDSQMAYRITIHYQGCGGADEGLAVCYPPETETFALGRAAPQINTPAFQNMERTRTLNALLDRFQPVRSDAGMKNAKELIAFLNTGQPIELASDFFSGKNIFFLLLLTLLGGVSLNFTPCVLPMIPINLAIIGAGATAANKQQGFIRGGVYGLGIALAYGSLGLFAALTGSKFGTLNASPIFNFVIAGIFIVLALALFDVLSIDLSRYSSRFGISNEKQGHLISVFFMGVIAALLAGACVAPIVIAVLLHATTLYAGGQPAGLFLPLLLGIGMALPWPIVGAGLTLLPKPGRWMVMVKYGFGVLIVLFALYYVHLGVQLLPRSTSNDSTHLALTELEEGLQEALQKNQLVFIDFWASWCKNCLQMEATTFKNPMVVQRLQDFKTIKFQAEKPSDPDIKMILDRYNLPGLPGYVILKPINTG